MKNIFRKSYLPHFIIGVVFFGLTFFLTMNMHSRSGYFNYQSEIWADKAGYYVYLPATFKYKFDPQLFPDSMDAKTGNGFQLDYENKKVRTKYFYGVSLMISPFYFAADILATPFGFEKDGFSQIYQKMMNVAAISYLLVALVLLALFLRNYFRPIVIYLSLFTIFFGTNLYYYAIDDTLMSHVYSFFLFSAYLFLIKKTEFLQTQKISSIFLLGVITGLMIITRPTNLLILSVFFFLDIKNFNDVISRIKRLLNLKFILTFSIGFILLVLPQLLYWKYLSGSFLTYTYAEEGFNFLSPKFLESWFSPWNGLILYSPIFLLAVVAAIYGIIKKHYNSFVVLAIFLLISYISASWWNWTFGCSFGGRNYVEYNAVFSISIAFLYDRILNSKLILKIIFFTFVAFLISYNLKLIYSFDECFYGFCCWDWEMFLKYFTK